MTKVEDGTDQTPFKEGAKKYKVQIGLSKAAVDRLFELKELTKQDAAAKVVREALRVYDILVEEVIEKDGQLFLRQEQDGELVRLKLF